MRARTIFVGILAVFLGVVLSLAPLLPFIARRLSQGPGLAELPTLREYVARNEVEYSADNSRPLLPILAIGMVGYVIGASTLLYVKRRLLSTGW